MTKLMQANIKKSDYRTLTNSVAVHKKNITEYSRMVSNCNRNNLAFKNDGTIMPCLYLL